MFISDFSVLCILNQSLGGASVSKSNRWVPRFSREAFFTVRISAISRALGENSSQDKCFRDQGLSPPREQQKWRKRTKKEPVSVACFPQKATSGSDSIEGTELASGSLTRLSGLTQGTGIGIWTLKFISKGLQVYFPITQSPRCHSPCHLAHHSIDISRSRKQNYMGHPRLSVPTRYVGGEVNRWKQKEGAGVLVSTKPAVWPWARDFASQSPD